MDRNLHDKIVIELGKHSPDTEIWPTFYGEALGMGDEIWDRIDFAAEAGCRNLVLNSNATLLRRKNHIDRILRSPLKRFILSLDGFSKETYEKIRYLGKCEESYGGTEDLLKERRGAARSIRPSSASSRSWRRTSMRWRTTASIGRPAAPR